MSGWPAAVCSKSAITRHGSASRATEIESSILRRRFESVQLVSRSDISFPLGTMISEPLSVRMMLARIPMCSTNPAVEQEAHESGYKEGHPHGNNEGKHVAEGDTKRTHREFRGQISSNRNDQWFTHQEPAKDKQNPEKNSQPA